MTTVPIIQTGGKAEELLIDYGEEYWRKRAPVAVIQNRPPTRAMLGDKNKVFLVRDTSESYYEVYYPSADSCELEYRGRISQASFKETVERGHEEALKVWGGERDISKTGGE